MLIGGGRHLTASWIHVGSGITAGVLRLSLTLPEQKHWNKQYYQEAYAQHSWLQSTCKKVLAASWDDPFRLLPADMQGDDLSFRQHMGLSPQSEITSPASVTPWHVLTGNESPLFRWANTTFDQCSAVHPLHWMIPAWQRIHATMGNTAISFVHVVDSMVVVCLLDTAGTPILVQAFPFTNEEDFLYFVMLAYKTGGLSPEHVPLVLSGSVDTSGKLYALLYRYVKTISTAALPDNVTLSSDLQSLPVHQFFDLLTVVI